MTTCCSLSGKEQQNQGVKYLVAFFTNFKRARNFSSQNITQQENKLTVNGTKSSKALQNSHSVFQLLHVSKQYSLKQSFRSNDKNNLLSKTTKVSTNVKRRSLLSYQEIYFNLRIKQSRPVQNINHSCAFINLKVYLFQRK